MKTLLPKTRGAVGCAHCQRLGAGASSCPVCGRPICEVCAADERSCPERGLSDDERRRQEQRFASARFYDADAEVALFGTEEGGVRALDLATGKSAVLFYTRARGCAPRLLPEGRVLSADESASAFDGLRIESLSARDSVEIASAQPAAGRCWSLRLSERGRFAVAVLSSGAVELFDCEELRAERTVRASKGAIQTVAASEEADLLALVTRVVDAVYVECFSLFSGEPRGVIPLKEEGVLHVRWIGVAPGLMALISARRLLAWRIVPGSPRVWPEVRDLPRRACRGVDSWREAALSHDGRLLVTKGDVCEIVVLVLETREITYHHGHTLGVQFVRFTRDGRTLLSFDRDNRLMRWPRDGDRLVSER